MLAQGVLSVLLTGEQHKGVARRPAVGVLDEEQALGAVRHGALGAQEGEHVLGRSREGEPPHADDHLVLLGQKLGHLVGCACGGQRLVLITPPA